MKALELPKSFDEFVDARKAGFIRVKDYVQNVINELGYSGLFSVEKGYGTGYKLPEKQADGGENAEEGK